jgi:hypothetical protein
VAVELADVAVGGRVGPGVDKGWTKDTGPALRPAIRLHTLDAHELAPREAASSCRPFGYFRSPKSRVSAPMLGRRLTSLRGRLAVPG